MLLNASDNLRLGSGTEAAVVLPSDGGVVKVNGVPTYGTIWLRKDGDDWRIVSGFLRRADKDYGFADATPAARRRLYDEALALVRGADAAELRAAEREDLLRRSRNADEEADELFARAARLRTEAGDLRRQAKGLE